MIDIYVSDLFGYEINNNTQFILIGTNEIHKLLTKVVEHEKSIIFGYNKKKIDQILKLRNVDPNNFVSLGHILYPPDPKVLILGNKKICKIPIGYTIVSKFGRGHIVRPYFEESDDNKKHYSMGLFYIDNNSKLTPEYIGIIPNQYLKKMEKERNLGDLGDLVVNDYFLLSSRNLGVYTINRNLFKQDDKEFKLADSNNSYLTMIDDKANMRSKQNTLTQTFSYNAQGELTSDGKCLEYDPNNVLFFNKCDNLNEKQKWLVTDTKISPSNDFSKCVESNFGDDDIHLTNCNNDIDSQQWRLEDPDVPTSSDFNWDKFKGKTVVLVENDNPWYVNKDTTVQMDYRKNEYDHLYDDIKYRNNADYKSKFVINTSKPDLGYGHSYASREGTPCEKVEGFGSLVDNNNMYIVIIILILLAIFYYRYRK